MREEKLFKNPCELPSVTEILFHGTHMAQTSSVCVMM